MRHRLLFATLFFTWLVALLVLTYYPNMPEIKFRVKDEWFRLDYVGHFGFYAGLMVLFLIWRAGWRAKIPGNLIFWTILGSLILGIGNEFIQRTIPGRSFNPVDMACNFLGILVGVAVAVALSTGVRCET